MIRYTVDNAALRELLPDFSSKRMDYARAMIANMESILLGALGDRTPDPKRMHIVIGPGGVETYHYDSKPFLEMYPYKFEQSKQEGDRYVVRFNLKYRHLS